MNVMDMLGTVQALKTAINNVDTDGCSAHVRAGPRL